MAAIVPQTAEDWDAYAERCLTAHASGPRTQTAAQWAATEHAARAAGLGDAQIAGLAIGCPVHGNAAMDWDAGEVFCYLIH